MQDAIERLVTALEPHHCQVTQRPADHSLLLTVEDSQGGNSMTKVIPLAELSCEERLATVIKDVRRDLANCGGSLDAACTSDLQRRGARIRRYGD
ncbi:DUF3509 domain-containing protein [Pseudomonas rhizoryzae]|uniref:DUF3509 domain-containing protein n=1 Tax=Pseudomonas rhizoryzae TaxID=2571129 RepID=UPI0010C17889|nr:DUF3509 domain-containing protein [Pseudomonas rhizoryzae]